MMLRQLAVVAASFAALFISDKAFSQSPSNLASIEIIDTSTNLSLATIPYEVGKTIVFNGDLSKQLALVVNLSSAVPSLKMQLKGPTSHINIERTAPYSLFGNEENNFNGQVFKSGTYGLTLTACDANKLKCSTKIADLQTNFSLPAAANLGHITRFEAIHVNTHPQPYKKLADLVPDANGKIKLSLQKGVQPNLLAKFSVDHPFGVKFVIKQINGTYKAIGRESVTPFAVWGNVGARLIPWRKVRSGNFEILTYQCASKKDKVCSNLIQRVELEVEIEGATPTIAPTATPSKTATAKPTNASTPRPSPTFTPKITKTPKPTSTPKPQATATPKPQASATPKPTVSATPKVTSTSIPAAPSSGALRKAASDEGMYVGFAVQSKSLGKQKYADIVKREGNILTAENECKPHMVLKQIYPTRKWDFSGCAKIIEFARDNNMAIRFHYLFGNSGAEKLPGLQDPKTKKAVEIYSIPKADTETFMKEYINKIVRLVRDIYPNGVVHYDLWNEIVNKGDNGQCEYKKNFWVNRLGDKVVADAFRWMRQADPKGILVWNDYKEYACGCELVKSLRSQGAPIDAFAFQAHGEQYEPAMKSHLKCFKDAGVSTQFTERETGVIMPSTGAKIRRQAKDFALTVALCKDPQYSCDTHVWWGVYDGQNYNDTCKRAGNNFAGCKGASLLFDEAFKKKMYPLENGSGNSSAYDDVVAELKK